MPSVPKKSLALDTNLLLDLAGRKDFAHDFKEEFLARGYSLFVPPTVVAELAFFARERLPQRDLAELALDSLRGWKCLPFLLSSAEMTVASRFATRLIHASLLPWTEQNDGKILAQASMRNIPLLATADKHLLDIDTEALLLAFNDADLVPVHAAHPRALSRAIR